MSGVLDKRTDGSMALFISGDLQFDSRDERIYHEALVLPALAVALQRTDTPLKVLVIGGGDGLTAREILRSNRIASIDLVDYDPQIVSLAKAEIAELNEGSLSNPLVTIHIKDAWEFVEETLQTGRKFDLIVSDLTVPEDSNGTRFHSIDWYDNLSRLLVPEGVLAVNACSPQATPRAYFSIFNSIAAAGLRVRPLHATIPSFSSLGYGDDWGFCLASKKQIEIDEVLKTLDLLEPGVVINGEKALRRLFTFSCYLFRYQAEAAPAALGSEVLLSYFYNDHALTRENQEESEIDALDMDFALLPIPKPDRGGTVLPSYINHQLAQAIHAGENSKVLYDVINLIPAVYRDHTPEVVSDFLSDPNAFLRGLDLHKLINMLLQRAAELPSNLVRELEDMRDKLSNWLDENINDLSLEHRVLTILTLVIVLGNLFYPDMVYAKNDGPGRRGRGDYWGGGWGGWYGGGGGWVNNNYYYPRKRIIKEGSPFGPGPSGPEIRNYYYPSRGKSVPQSTLPIDDQIYGDGHKYGNSDLERLRNRMLAERQDLSNYKAVLETELKSFECATDSSVIFGTQAVSPAEAIKRTKVELARVDSQLTALGEAIKAVSESIV